LHEESSPAAATGIPEGCDFWREGYCLHVCSEGGSAFEQRALLSYDEVNSPKGTGLSEDSDHVEQANLSSAQLARRTEKEDASSGGLLH
jgi:hypothetical protein